MGIDDFANTIKGYFDPNFHLRNNKYKPIVLSNDQNTAYAVHDKANPGKVPERLPDLINAEEKDTKGVQPTNTRSRTGDMEPNDPTQRRLFPGDIGSQGGKKRTKKGKKAKKNKSKKAKKSASRRSTKKHAKKHAKIVSFRLIFVQILIFLHSKIIQKKSF